MLNKLLLCLGSNKNKVKNIELASQKLYSCLEQVKFSDIIESRPLNSESEVESYLNRLALAYTSLSLSQTLFLFKELEKELGWKPEDKFRKSIPIDIDLLQWNEKILKEEDIKREYVINGLQSLPLE
ncbi:MAG: 2-amino-4-hydroxy-6-hydroxymethyldihydropteridine diphosphokinase [Tannerellaceae bacterium]|nr:2-amino-4-hydroxy-6-hydroxymethyldihydropteridine diphosphokinase [Tannerellaceae bacterium]